MIFAITGSDGWPFDRLVRLVDELETDEKKLIQYGNSVYIPRRSVGHKYLSFDQVKQAMSEARVVITHGGTGSVMLAMSLGKVPIVAPRYKHFHEHVDNHQLQLVESLESEGLIVPLLAGDSLKHRIDETILRLAKRRKLEPDPRLVAALRKVVNESPAG